MKNFKITQGTMIGQKHIKSGEKNQDSLYIEKGENFILGVVSDGFSGPGTYTEVGSRLGSIFLLSRMFANLNLFEENKEEFFKVIKKELLIILSNIITSFNLTNEETFHYFIHNFFKFTLVGFIVTEKDVLIFSIGDGFYKLNTKEELISLENTNLPMYIIGTGGKDSPEYNFNIRAVEKTDNLKRLIISTDGIEYYLKNNKVEELFTDINLNEKLYEVKEELHDDIALIVIERIEN